MGGGRQQPPSDKGQCWCFLSKEKLIQSECQQLSLMMAVAELPQAKARPVTLFFFALMAEQTFRGELAGHELTSPLVPASRT